ncbi:putative reverse transcriptase domain-containing protein [Tanacetum coccineum]
MAPVFTDHKSLQHILDQKELNMRQRRWLELLSELNVDIVINQGKQTRGLCRLSRKETELAIAGSSLSLCDNWIDMPKRILEAQIEAQKPENIVNEDVGGVDTMLWGLEIRDNARIPHIEISIHPETEKMYQD